MPCITLNKQTLLISAVSGTLSITGYIILKKLFFSEQSSNKNVNIKKNDKKVEEGLQEASKIYEDKALLDQYMMFNFSSDKEMLLFDDLNENSDVKNCFLFPKRVALLCREHCPDIFFSDQSHPRSALDVGCAVGRSCFELSKFFDKVVGIDYSASFIKYCDKVLKEKIVPYECTLEGNVTQKLIAKLDHDVNADVISFEVGDACHLRSDLGEYDLVLASNLICRLVEPMKFLNRLKKLVKKNGYAIISTPFSWGPQYTPVSNWLGGYYDYDGKPIEGFEGLKAALDDTFDLKKTLSLPMVIRETKRKFQYTVCLVSIWQKK